MDSKLLVILGNGPSLKDVDFKIFDHPDIHTFGMNMAYRKYKQIGFRPTYYGCFDLVVTNNTIKDFSDLVYEWSDTKFFYINTTNINNFEPLFPKDVMSQSNFIKLKHFYPSEHNNLAVNFEEFHDAGNTGCNSTQVGLMLGYKKILLIGCDANYVEKVEGAEEVNTLLVMKETPSVNVNYWFDDYHVKGDVYNLPGASYAHRDKWLRLSNIYKIFYPDAEIVNCSSLSQIEGFRKSNLLNEINNFTNSVSSTVLQ